jgi:V-type H+-transporting ATPase subunit B
VGASAFSTRTGSLYEVEQVKFPKYNEIVSLTLADGSVRSGQVLEARGTAATQYVDMDVELC